MLDIGLYERSSSDEIHFSFYNKLKHIMMCKKHDGIYM